jgi:hypothetical protein
MIRIEAAEPAAKPRRAAKTAATPPPAPNGRLDTLLALLRRPEGVTLDEGAAATGWKPHSVRARIGSDISKRMGLAVSREIVEGRGRVYRIAP